MFVKITAPAKGAWWEHKIGQVYEVKEDHERKHDMFRDTHYELKKPITDNDYALAISKDCCRVLNPTNKKMAGLLSREE